MSARKANRKSQILVSLCKNGRKHEGIPIFNKSELQIRKVSDNDSEESFC